MQKSRILLQINIGKLNTQWVNYGAGIWQVNFDNIYSFIDSTLLPNPPFSVQNGFNEIGSVDVDNILYTKCMTLSEISTTEQSFYWDTISNTLYIHVINNDEIFLHTVFAGVVFAYSFDAFKPIGSEIFYEGRLLGIPTITRQRDPLYYGKLQFPSGEFTLNNADGFFDTFVEDNAVYGFGATVLFGYDDQNITEYIPMLHGYMEKPKISETEFSIQVTDKRKQLSKAITYSCTAKNALDAIVEILTTSYTNITYTSAFFDVDSWEFARQQVNTVTINMQKPDSVINVIQDICASVFGLFIVTSDDKFSFKIVDTTSNSRFLIPNYDILNDKTFDYDTDQVISSIRVGYNKNWTTTTNQYTYLTNTDYEDDVFDKYKTYNQKDFDTLLPTLAEATEFSNTIMEYVKDVHAQFEIVVPMDYINVDLTDMVFAELKRQNADIFGIKKCEVIKVQYNLNQLTMTLGLRKYDQTLFYLVDENGVYLTGDDGFITGVQYG